MLIIDGSYGEGGGQILRSALALSILTGRPFRLENIRAGRKRPGLMRQHLTAVRAAAEISGAGVQGAELCSQTLSFEPGEVRGGDYEFSVGTAGSTMLVLQTVLLPLLHARAPSRVRLEGGTHARNAPPFDYVATVYLPLLRQMGADAEVSLERYGFYPAGGGQVSVAIEPLGGTLERLELVEGGPVQERSLKVVSAFLSEHVAVRESVAFCEATGWSEDSVHVLSTENADSPGNIMLARVGFAGHAELFSAVGQKGRPAETVAGECAEQVRAFQRAGVPVGPYLSDQLLLPMALGRGGRFRTLELTGHGATQIWLIPKFLDVQISVEEIAPGVVEVDVETP